MRRRVLVLHSGGMDSTVCLAKAHREGADVISLGIDYGQRLSVEMQFASEQCARLGIHREVIAVAWRKPEREIPVGRAVEEMARQVSPAFLPSRNVLFLALASAHAAGVQADEIHIGLNCIEFSGYPDCTPAFLESFKAMINLANPGGAEIIAPLLMLDKQAIARMAFALGIGEYDTWSCYRPKVHEGSIAPCGECDACILHKHAWATVDQS